MRPHDASRVLGYVLLLFVLPAVVWAQSPTLQEIKTSLTCLCGCNMTVEACQGAMNCQSADKLTAEAQQLIDRGLTKKQILATFVQRYGEHILSAPTKKGFNLTAWITPFLAIGLTGFVIVKIVQKWAQRAEKRRRQLAGNGAARVDPALEKMLDDVLKNLD